MLWSARPRRGNLASRLVLVPYLGATGEEQAVECITFGRDDLVKQPRDRGK